MTSHHHQCHCRFSYPPPTPPTIATTITTCYCSTCSTTNNCPPPSQPPLHSISSHLRHNPPPQHHLYVPPYHHSHQTLYYDFDYFPPQPHINRQHYRQQEVDHQEPPLTPAISSLLRRIAALESSFIRQRSPGSSSLRDMAARTIQIHFRAFLVRRSKTLRHLEELAFIKSALNTLKSSVSKRTHFDYQLINRESMNLLLKLDSIQGSDPMIRGGKRSISRELIRFMEFIDEISPKSRVISMKNVRFGKNSNKTMDLQRQQKIRASDSGVFGCYERDILEKLRNQVKKSNGFSRVPEGEGVKVENPSVYINGKIGGTVKIQSGVKSQPEVKKNVSFAENGNVYRVIRSSHGPVSSDDSDSINGDREVDEIGVSSTKGEAAKIKEEEEEENDEEDSQEMSDNERDPRKNLRSRSELTMKKELLDQEEEDDEDEDDTDSFVFAAPLPVKMEYRVDSENKKQSAKS